MARRQQAVRAGRGAWARCRRSTPPRRTLPGDGYVGPGGLAEMRGYPTLVGRSKAAQDAETARSLWELSEELTGVASELVTERELEARLDEAVARTHEALGSSSVSRRGEETHVATVQDVESALIESVCERVRERVAPDEVAEAEAFVRSYYRRAPAADLRGREPVDLYGAALAHWTFGRDRARGRAARARLQPDVRAARLAVAAHRDRDRQRRHAVPRGLGEHGAQPARAGIHVLVHPVVGDESYMHIEIDRQADGLEELAEALRGVLGRCAPRSRTGGRCASACRRWSTSRAPPGVDAGRGRGGAGAAGVAGDHHFTFLGYREYALDGETRCARVEGTGLGLLRGGVGHVSTAFAKLPPAVRALACEPHLLVLTKANARSPDPPAELPRLRRRQALRRRRQRRRRAALPRPLHDAAYREVPANIPVLRRKVAGGASSAPGSRPAATTTRRWSRSSTRSRATSCSRWTRRALRGRARDPRAGRAPARPAVHAHGPLRAVRVLPRLPPARPLQHRQPGPDRRDPARGARRRDRSTGGCG